MGPSEFRAMVDGVRAAEKAVGRVTYELSPKARRNRKFSRSLFVVEDIGKGEKFTSENVRSIRPGDGMHPRYYGGVIGRKASRALKRGTPLRRGMISGRKR
ncbi:MAG TPA: SAF domain-containing protein [Elusimicrobiales bacterium]|nr:SAF domain-containing protein [Elusimicrobiales bacterium]